MNTQKYFFLVPRLYNAGGVANYYQVVKPHLNNDIQYIYRGKKEIEKHSWLRFINDYFSFIKTIWKAPLKNLVVINTSLGQGSIFRDGFYAWLCPGSAKKIIFFRGWDPDFQQKIDNSEFLKKWVMKTFLTADHIIVLSSKFKEKLIQWGYKKEISIETTLVDENLVKDFDIVQKGNNTKNLLFLSAVTKSKGIMEALEAFHILTNNKSDLVFHIAGEGAAMPDIKSEIELKKPQRVNLLGYVTGNKKAEVFQTADLFIFPSYHEGMPNAVLEAMAFGLPVITTRVGGLPDFFEDGKMGLFLDNHSPEHIAEKIEYLLDRPELMKQMSEYNYHYAKERFYASKVAKRLENIIESVARES